MPRTETDPSGHATRQLTLISAPSWLDSLIGRALHRLDFLKVARFSSNGPGTNDFITCSAPNLQEEFS